MNSVSLGFAATIAFWSPQALQAPVIASKKMWLMKIWLPFFEVLTTSQVLEASSEM